MLITRSWENLDHIPTNTEFPPLEINVIAFELNIHQIIEQTITRNLQTWTQAHYAIRVFFGRTQPIDTGNRRDDNDVIAF